VENPAATGIRFPDRPVRSESKTWSHRTLNMNIQFDRLPGFRYSNLHGRGSLLCSFPEHGSCHRMSRGMEALYAVNLPFSVTNILYNDTLCNVI